ncbi:flagellar biosynthetic protein FliR [Paenibacillus sp. TRM 82003]|uniref:flagellar biosynthetic protein FliR n=1 Tax=Kineococcus sp. TRM81007 TaxID=2925831 RepID=UPI001F57D78E|nr:flagellar biosynthetic protein FliR [Kineococcus sp. TRM81007]MCI2240595.1 flagellar biosynthetic protein FliR [Kineococcus sp. TRM81007]MCI3925483.1 flagellar biosynthetic protein FliR [Paenibacillus sp. TRM 82003]
MQGLSTTVGLDLLLAVLLASVRAVAFLMLAPPFASRAVNGRVKAMLALALVLPVAGQLRGQVPAAEPAALIGAIVQQVVVGAVLGAFCALVFAAVQAAGDLLDLFGGFQLASAYDPLNQTQSAIFGKLYNWTATALLVLSGGHLLVLQGFLRTYEVLPLDAGLSFSTVAQVFTTGIGQLMLSALQIAAPLVAVLFVADIGLGLLSRVAPALNVFAMSFPLKILIVLTLGGFAFAVLPEVVDDIAGTLRETLVRLTGRGGGGE